MGKHCIQYTSNLKSQYFKTEKEVSLLNNVNKGKPTKLVKICYQIYQTNKTCLEKWTDLIMFILLEYFTKC